MKTSEEKREKRLALIYCADNGINFEEFYYKSRKQEAEKKDRKERKAVCYDSLEEAKENYYKDGFLYHDTKENKYFYDMAKYVGKAWNWNKVKRKYPNIKRYRIERIYEVKGIKGTRKEINNILFVEPCYVYKVKNKKVLGYRITKAN